MTGPDWTSELLRIRHRQFVVESRVVFSRWCAVAQFGGAEQFGFLKRLEESDEIGGLLGADRHVQYDRVAVGDLGSDR